MDKVRASRDGHEFHEAWAARQALKLVMPTDDFVGIAVEGTSPQDQKTASAKTVEIADLVLYFGERPVFEFASSIVILQLKYSKASENDPFRASDAKKTINKFSDAYITYKKNHSVKDVEKKLAFELLTNRPILPEFNEAISGLATGTSLKGVAKTQATQFKSASGLSGIELSEFAKKIKITGLTGNLKQNKQHISHILADWSVAPDAMARARLGNLKELIRDKAGLAGESKNVVTRIDVLDALELQGPEDLFPCPSSFPDVGQVVARQQLNDVANKIPALTKPLLIHADGGVGKTVFFQSLSKMLSDTHEVVLFDCFGGGNYRVPEDARHLPKRGLIHIINNLACKGLCDPLLPNHENVEDLVKAFRVRLAQAVATVRRVFPEKQLLLFLDAIDNAAEHAKDKGELAFPTLLLESFHHGGPVNGVQLILSCRTYRRDISRGNIPRAACEELELKPFNPAEAEMYLRGRIPTVTNTEIQVAYSRSLGNPRILEHLALSDRGLLDSSEIKNVILLDDLLRERIQLALTEALKRGYKESDINAFLAGLSVLPLPVPLDEYSEAHGMNPSAVRSFAADLAPLLEQTKYGLMFRDEPTETLLREDYATKVGSLETLAKNLLEMQGTSVYAARSLPGLLQKIDDGESLFNLAFEDRFPTAITSIVGMQNIRYARLKAAVLHSVKKENYDRLVRLLVELSMLAVVNQRGTDYVLNNPDLVIASQDIDATKRLFEIRTHWPGTRHARLAIASVLAGDQSDALRHSVKANEWIRHFYEQNDEYRRERGGPERLDIASIPVCLLAESRGCDAANLMKGWRDWYAFEVAEHIFTLLNQAQAMKTISTEKVSKFLHELKSQPGMLSAALSFLNLDDAICRSLINYLAKACRIKKTFEINKNFNRESSYQIQDGLLKAASLAVAMEMHAEALTIAFTFPLERPRLWSFSDRYSNKDAFSFITHTAISGAIKRQPIVARDILPQEFVDIGARVENSLTGEGFRKALKVELEAYYNTQQELADAKQQISYETKRENERFIDGRLEPLLEIVQSLTVMLSSAVGKGDKHFQDLLNVWIKLRKKREHYSDLNGTNSYFDKLGIQLLIFVLWSRNDLKAASVETFLEKLGEDGAVGITTLIDVISTLSKRADLQELAGKTAIKAKTLIELEDEVESRASLFAELSRAILPASLEEASSYFRSGLEQMDAIGSGDYQFTNELLLFAAELKGDELEELDLHTLSNICELNMHEAEKFPWFAFARGLSRTSGLKMLAKLGRWADRDKVSLDYTLLPYLTALIEYDKIDPAIALALLRISSPAELYVCGTEQLAEVIVKKRYANSKELVSELILQFEQNHPGVFMPSTQATLSKLAEREIGKDSEQSIYLSVAAPKFKILQNENNEHYNYRGTSTPKINEAADELKVKNLQTLKAIVDRTSSNDETSMSQAIDSMNGIQNIFDLKGEFLDGLRAKVGFADRSKYVQIIARLESLDIYTKLSELKTCKVQWSDSSTSINKTLKEIGVSLVRINAEDFVSHDYLSDSKLKEVADLSETPISILANELIAIFAASDSLYPASIWMRLAAIICEKSKDGEGQAALKRLLNSNSAKLSSSVTDGAWKEGIYPKEGQIEIAAGLTWLALGSPAAEVRWRAAHSIRCFARFGKWEVINEIVGKYQSTDAHPYQATELSFFNLHARLWLLIALARVAIDYPANVAKYADILKTVAFDKEMPHVLLRHFASKTLLACLDCGSHVTSKAEVDALMKVNQSFFPQVKMDKYAHDLIYQSRPDSIPKHQPEFYLDYDFKKTDVASLCNMFDKPGWETIDAITAQARKFDHKITSMYETGGRATIHQSHLGGMNSRIHTYGQQLGFHALYLVAGEFLTKYPIILRPYQEEDSWSDWLNQELLTRDDGLWLSDGIDRIPIDAQLNLKEKAKKEIVLTSHSKKLLALLNIESHIAQELVVAGDWRSADDIHIHISSALVPCKDATKEAFTLSKKMPFDMWLPSVEYDDEIENSFSRKEPYKPWIVWPYSEARLDARDLLGSISAVRKLHFTKAVNVASQLRAEDPFKRKWIFSNEKIAARSEAWVSHRERGQDESECGRRLVCSSELLSDVLQKESAELLVLIILTNYEEGYSGHGSKFWHTTAVVRVNQSLDFEYYCGAANKLHEMKY